MKINLENEIKNLVEKFEVLQYNHKPNYKLIENLPIMSRDDLRNTNMQKGFYSCKSSGSTGEPVTVQKSVYDFIWYGATNLREIKWRKWDMSKNVALIKPNVTGKKEIDNWGYPPSIHKNQGKQFLINYTTIDEIQSYLEEKNPHYIHCAPSIVKQLDLSRITNLIDVKGTGEVGGSMYSSEECGTIAIECPTNKENYHVMENHIVERDVDGGIIITTLTNAYIRRYKHGDLIDFGTCNCGRTLQTINKIHGRIRNMFVMEDGRKKWPLFGSRTYHEKYGIKRYKLIQKTFLDVELQIIAEKLNDDKVKELVQDIRSLLDVPVNVEITYVDSFPNYKHEEFVSLVAQK